MYRPADPTTWAWLKLGDHRNEAHALCQRCQQQNHDPVAAEIEVKFVKGWTILIADGPWWQEQMTVHPNGWQGGPLDDLLDFFGAQS